MNRDDVLRIANEVRSKVLGSEEQDIAFASRIEAATREECAKICEAQIEKVNAAKTGSPNDLADTFLAHHATASYNCAAAIRKSEGGDNDR